MESIWCAQWVTHKVITWLHLLSCDSSENADVMLGKMMKYMAVQSDKADTNVSHHTMTAGFFFVQRL